MFNWNSNKNCPFCGGEPEITQAIENDLTSLVATCPDDDCVGSTIRCGIDLWNLRVNEPDTVSVFKLKLLTSETPFNNDYVLGYYAAIDHLRKQHPNGIKWGD